MAKNKKLGIFSGVAASVGLVLGSTCFVTLGQGAGYGGKWFSIAILAVMVICLCAMTSFTELGDLFPKSEGNIPTIWGAVFGPVGEIINNWVSYFSCVCIFSAMEAVLAAHVFTDTFCPSVPWMPIAIAITVALTVANLRGVDVFSKIQNIVFTFMIFTLVALCLVGAFGLSSHPQATDNVPTYTGGSAILELGCWAAYIFICLELIIPMAKDMKNPKRDIRISLFIGAGLLAAVYILMSIGLSKYIPNEILYVNELPNVVYAETLFGKFGLYWMGIATIFAAVSTTNTGIQSCPRMLAGSGNDGTMPKIFKKTNKAGAAYVSIIFMGIVQVLLIVFSSVIPMASILLVSCLFYEIGCIGDHIIVLILRKRYPFAKERVNKLRLFNIPQIGATICLVYLAYTMVQDSFVLVGSAITIVVVSLYAIIWSKCVMKRSPFKAVPNEDIDDLEMEHKMLMSGNRPINRENISEQYKIASGE